MEANGMRARFNLGYEASRLSNRTFNDREIQDFLNKSQLELTKERAAPWKNRPQIGFGQHPIRNAELAGLITATQSVPRDNFILGNSLNGALKGPDLDNADQEEDIYGVFVGMPNEVLYPIIETCETLKGSVNKTNTPIKEVSLDEYQAGIFDEYAKPYDNLVWSIDWGSYTTAIPATHVTGNGNYTDSAKDYSSTGTGFNMEGLNQDGDTIEINTNRSRYLIPGKGWKVTKYVIFYIKKPRDIVIDVQTPSLQVHCELPDFIHQDIVDKAVKLASAAIIPEQSKYQVNQIESKEDE